MPTIRIYEAALCCDTGVCGVDVDQSLVTITADVRGLQELGVDIERHNLAGNPTAFTDDKTVRGFMHTVGSKGLPLTVVDGATVATGSYLDRSRLLELAGVAVAPEAPAARLELGLIEKVSGGCCGGTGSC